MTAIEGMYTKINGSWIKSAGGDTTSVLCPNISSTNSSGFKIGELSYNFATCTNNAVTCVNSTWTDVVSSYLPFTDFAFKICPPFTYEDDPSFYPTSITANSYMGRASETYEYGGFRAIRNEDSSVLATKTFSFPENWGTVTTTLTITFPSDWDFETDTIKFQFYHYHKYQSNVGQHAINAGTMVAGTGTTSNIVYYNPVAEEK